jgi:hypothetical protein
MWELLATAWARMGVRFAALLRIADCSFKWPISARPVAA